MHTGRDTQSQANWDPKNPIVATELFTLQVASNTPSNKHQNGWDLAPFLHRASRVAFSVHGAWTEAFCYFPTASYILESCHLQHTPWFIWGPSDSRNPQALFTQGAEVPCKWDTLLPIEIITQDANKIK